MGNILHLATPGKLNYFQAGDTELHARLSAFPPRDCNMRRTKDPTLSKDVLLPTLQPSVTTSRPMTSRCCTENSLRLS